MRDQQEQLLSQLGRDKPGPMFSAPPPPQHPPPSTAKPQHPPPGTTKPMPPPHTTAKPMPPPAPAPVSSHEQSTSFMTGSGPEQEQDNHWEWRIKVGQASDDRLMMMIDLCNITLDPADMGDMQFLKSQLCFLILHYAIFCRNACVRYDKYRM